MPGLADLLSPHAALCPTCGHRAVIFDPGRLTCWDCTPPSYQAAVERVAKEDKPAKAKREKKKAAREKPQGKLF